MQPETEENYKEKLRLVVAVLIDNLDSDIRKMLAEHSAKGLLRSGATVKRTMDFISTGNASFYESVMLHLSTLEMTYYSTMEQDIQKLAADAQIQFRSQALIRFSKSTSQVNKPHIYERLLPDIEASMASDLANFQNTLNATMVTLKQKNSMPLAAKLLWGLEVVALLATMFLAGMWYKDPTGNYEPLLVGLGVAVPFIAVAIKIASKK